MTRKILVSALALIMAALAVTPAAEAVVPPKKEQYESSPFNLAAPAIPHVLLVMSKDLHMYQQAYVPLVDFDGDGRVDTGFNPAVVYTGYYDPYSCYGYSGSADKWDSSTVVNDGGSGFVRGSVADPNGYFRRVGKAPAQTSVTRPSAIANDVPLPVSATGICRSISSSGGGTFSGNWLNYLTTSRIDAIRKILYGGKRVVDATGKTVVLEASFVPPDSTTWGMEIMADDLWSNTTALSSYYDIRDYTPFDKPKNGTAHFFARTRDRSNGNYPVFRMLPNASKTSFNVGGKDSVNSTVVTTDISKGDPSIANARYWDWVLGNRPCPNDESLKNDTVRKSVRTYKLHIEVCAKGNYDPVTEKCQEYNGDHKPIGLLQEYGTGVNGMNFGLLTGSYDWTRRIEGGVLRNHIDSINAAIDKDSGQIKKTGLIANLDRLQMSGRFRPLISGPWPEAAYKDINSWGNPVGEMLFEGVRYFASLSMAKDGSALKPTVIYAAADSDDSGASPPSPVLSLTSYLWSWTTDRPSRTGLDCAKPIILLISDINAEYDGDTFATDLKQSRLSTINPAVGVNLPDQFNMKTYLDSITTVEQYAGKKFFFSKNMNDQCSSKTLTSLDEVAGLCPHAPTFMGTYSTAAAAYYAHTHDFALADDAGNKTQEESIDVYSVTMSAAFPELTFAVKDSGGNIVKKASILPFNSNSDTPNRIYAFLNYYIIDWQTDKHGNPFSVTIQVNFTDLYEGHSDWEMDVITQYKIDLLTTGATAANKRTSAPIVTSGTKNICGTLKGQSLYGFQNHSRNSLDDYIEIDPGEVVGLSVETQVLREGSAKAMGIGYTISGVKKGYNGTYYEVRPSYPAGANPASNYLTPYTCEKPLAEGGSTQFCGPSSKTTLPQYQVRTFEFGPVDEAEFLPNPMWLAAKFGGFKDHDSNGRPDDGEWDSQVPGTPDNYFQATNISTLAAQLGAAFEAISKSVATGTATSASINSILGGGISIQTLYYTEYTDPNNKSVNWVGNVYGLFIDKWGNMREDSNNNGKLDVVTGEPGKTTGDFVVEFAPNTTGRPLITRHRDIKGDNTIGDAEQSGLALEDLKMVWNTSQWLAGYNSSGGLTLRSGWEPYKKVPYRTAYKEKAESGRRIYSYFPDDLNSAANTGGMPAPAYLDGGYHFSSDSPYAGKMTPYLLQAGGLGLPIIFSGPSASQYFTITPYGPRPSGDIRVVIKKSPSLSDPVTVGVTASGNDVTITVTRRTADGTAADVVQAINSKASGAGGMHGGQPLVKAALADGDNGSWKPDDTSASGINVNSSPEDSAKLLIEYIRGQDITGFRSRTVQSPWKSSDQITWRLGDIINSKPIIVGAPASNYDLIYRDSSYSKFKGRKVEVTLNNWILDNKNSARRQVAYVGGNDGMLHAINVGFYGSLADGQSGYTTETDNALITLKNPPKHELGSEIWAYIPTAVLPHLQWLADPDYNHSYYVDLKPQLVDLKNNSGKNLSSGAYNWPDKEWRTILINGLRLGGRSINMTDDGSVRSYSEYFALDVNDPEEPPALLWRFSHPRLGMSISQPTVVSSGGKWYVVLASGPTYDKAENNGSTGEPLVNGADAYYGLSNQSARLFILDALTGKLIQEIDSQVPNSFFNDSFTPLAPNRLVYNKGTDDCRWDNHVVYFGLTVSPDNDGLEKGGVYRLKMVDFDGSGNPQPLPENQWEFSTLFDAGRPVTGSVNAAYDSLGNLWVVFGTGRLWSARDSTPCAEIESLNDSAKLQACLKNHEQYLFGVKEPLGSKGFMSFDPVPNGANLIDLSKARVFSNGVIEGAGSHSTYRSLQNDLSGSVYDGYRRKMQTWSLISDPGAGNLHEVIVTQPKIAGLLNGGSLATFTSHEPSTDECSRQGRSYLYVVDTFTGIPAPYMGDFGFYNTGESDKKNSDGDVVATLVTGYIHAGLGQSTEAVIIGDNIKTKGQGGEDYDIPIPKGLLPQSAIISWREVFDMGFSMSEEDMKKGSHQIDGNG